MSEKHQKNIQFWEIVLAVVLGLQIFQWLQEYSSEIKNFPWWTLIIAYAVISVTISQWHEKRWWRDHDKKELEFVRSQGFESWAEYMVVHGEGEDIRESWKKTADKEKQKREKKKK